MSKIAIIGGGVAGATSALYLGKLGLNVTLFEKESSLVSGPPFCHLHAGGNLYREISDTQCITLLKQSIAFLRFYPYIVDYRPTVIVLPKSDKSTPKALLSRLELLKNEYKNLIKIDSKNQVLGSSDEYYQLYTKEKLLELKKRNILKNPKKSDEWMVSVAKNIDMDRVQFPFILVQEYGLNLFRLASGLRLELEGLNSVKLHTNSIVTDIKYIDNKFKLTYKKDSFIEEDFDYIINSAGFRTGKIDDMLDVPCKSMVEFKSAYISHCDSYIDSYFPEIIFHGERGTPQGMGQFTPYPNGHFQLHGMTNSITLYEDGLVANSTTSCQPKLKQKFIKKIENSWSKEEISERTLSAIEHISKFLPSFSKAKVASKPLFGAQQIVGDDPTLRVAEVSFPIANYARCEIVKVSSVLDMIYAIVKDFVKLGFIDKALLEKIYFDSSHLKEDDIEALARSIALEREYPSCLANRSVENYYI